MAAPEQKTPWANIRHDLRTPINHILGYSELLEEDLIDQGIKGGEDLKKIQGAARTLLELIGSRLSDENLSSIATLGLPLDNPPNTAAPPAAVTEAPSAAESLAVARIPGHILVVDDNEENRTVLARRLERQGHTTAQAVNGREALEMVSATHFDLVLLDVIMPEVDGYTTLLRMKEDTVLRHIPVIMISALDEIASVVRCIEAGAEDYLPKPFNPTILRARIGAGLEKKKLRDQEQAYLEQIEETQKRLEDELQEAARYVVSILPPPMEEPFRIGWAYDPSTELGGDSFGYHWIDETHFAIYLLDVCGHGVGAALLSVAAINVIRSGSLPKTNFLDPGEVLTGLNDAFQMERHNNMYFTIWYGVYNTADRTLRHASGGHPPAILLHPGEGKQMDQLRCPGMLIGAMPEMTFDSETTLVPPGARLFVYCDGAYEIKRPDGTMIDFDHDFLGFLSAHAHSKTLPDEVLAWIRTIHTGEALDDDYSFVAMDFPS
ncbi:SpoIIE family protein phosphatase [soil metagenome]